MRKVIAVAGPVGAGKSSLTQALARALGDAPVLRFDDYQQATRQSVEQLEQWLSAGADFNTLEAPGLLDALEQLRGGAGESGWLVFEMPLGRAYRNTAGHIDLLVWLDIPLDVALARKLRELAGSALAAGGPNIADTLHWMHDYLAHYMAVVRRVLLAQQACVKAEADLVVDGEAASAALVHAILVRTGATH